MSKKEFTIGADPELFIFNTENKEFIPSFEIFKGGKRNPEIFYEEYAVLSDNAMVEFNIPPSDNELDFITRLNTAMEYIQRRLPENCFLTVDEEAEFSKQYTKNERFMEFGCAPQKNMYNIPGKHPYEIPENIRFAGGHIHIGINGQFDKKRLVKFLDIFVGLPLLTYKNKISRQDFYGMPGNFRDTSYGLEYRTPSNNWLKSNESISNLYQSVNKAVQLCFDKSIKELSDNEIIEAFYFKTRREAILSNYMIEEIIKEII